LLHQDRGWQVARRGVDGITEQHELHQWNHDDHRKGDAIAAKLDELLGQHGAGAAPESGSGKTAERAHWKLSCALAMRSMNTSSSEASERVHTSPWRSR